MNIKKQVYIYSILSLIVIAGCKNDTTPKVETKENSLIKIEDKLNFAELENVDLKGCVGQEINKIIDKRIASDFAANEIATEATKAFEIRMDDKFHEGRGLWQGEFWGKWTLSAIAAYRYTGDQNIKNTIERETKRLIASQDVNGYIGSYENSAFVEGDVWNVWNRKYALWGLVESYELLKNPEILKAAKGMMDQLMGEVGPNSVPMVDTGNFYGLPSSSILTPLVKLYLDTGEKRYLDYAEYIVQNWHSVPDTPPSIVEKGLTGIPVHEWFPEKGKWTKAYEFISCVEGLLDLYQVVGNPDYLTAAKNIYTAIQENERVITGGIGYHDKLVGASHKPSGLNEPCDVVYWERLSAKLLALTGDQSYADEIERLTYNVLLASANMTGDWGVRRLGLNEPHLISPLHAFTNYHQCCVANVPRGLLQLGQVAVMSDKTNDDIYINLYDEGTYKIKLSDGKMVTLKMETDYPKNGEVSIKLITDEPFEGGLVFRQPEWCQKFQMGINGEDELAVDINGNSQIVDRLWKNGDEIKVAMEVFGRIIEIPDENNFKAIMWGPVVLARSSILEGFESLDNPMAINNDIKLSQLPDDKKNSKVWLEFKLDADDGKSYLLCDYASTGKEYEKPTDPTAWQEMIKNRVNTDQRVWLKTVE
ncbi:glycoside hydrolase family 127 protein [Maribacter sp. PR1]|uniref:Beta-L-arabinofuranosidase domain-containing protein n=1 Tax=Maribacter cobaltidurans TaxID=1178778 RepID=A0ABU7IZ79_9FLAO|nr:MULTISPECIES: beta-L-arabinofuranosidase domain-containing protein [Maribacter]MDC6390417.1 glycoside hydrolase family 127 protein [Maribacter sp. PR1]MEE1977806.1 beta-L-arabinofuranosidase domain-containing protein [Maribacter cobaltidurans]|tara:strand:- start:26007 stop:27953 length:1947 start_codon:yes stop_codon:yes gene_type:complete